MTISDFRGAVNRLADGVDIHHRARAADEVLRWLRGRGSEPQESDVEAAAELARKFARTAEADPQESEPLPPTAYSRETAQLWSRLLRPWAEKFRREVFSSVAVPFGPTEWPAAVEWIEGALGDAKSRVSLSDLDKEDRLLISRAQGIVAKRRIGRLSYETLSRTLRYYGPDGSDVRRGLIAGHETGWNAFLGHLSLKGPAIVNLDNLSRKFEELSGIHQPELVRTILCDIEPTLPRARVRGRGRTFALPDGTQIRGRRVTVDFLTPDVTWEELHDLHRHLRQMWSSLGVRTAANGPKKRPRLTELDRRMLEVVEHLGGAPETLDAEWWESLDREFRRRGYPSRSKDAHRKHWSRLQEKIEKADVLPAGDLFDQTELP